MEKWYERFEDDEFINYYKSGEATAVHVVRDCAEEINTAGKWIDVISVNIFETQHKRKTGWIIAELFPRINQPIYTADEYYNRYLTWHAAHDDIAIYRSKNHHGEKFFVLFKKENEKTDYFVFNSCKINQKQIRTIKANHKTIVSNICKKRTPSLELFHIYNIYSNSNKNRNC